MTKIEVGGLHLFDFEKTLDYGFDILGLFMSFDSSHLSQDQYLTSIRPRYKERELSLTYGQYQEYSEYIYSSRHDIFDL
jgi:hypothetical protein